MLYKHANLNIEMRENILGGNGQIPFTHLFLPEDAFCAKGKLFSHITLKPGTSIGTHTHNNEFEIYYILKGEGKYNNNGVSVTVQAGDVTVCNDGEEHGMENNGKEDLEMIILILYT